MDSPKIRNSLQHIRFRNRSLNRKKSLSVIPAGNLKPRISALLKNNKELASCLQETRCELSDKQKILDGYSVQITNIKYARLKMLQMSSALKSFVTSFDEILLLLNADETTDNLWLEPRFPLRSRSRAKFISSLGKIQESSREIIQADSTPIGSDDTHLILSSASEKLLGKVTESVVSDCGIENLHLINNKNSLHCFHDVENMNLSNNSNIAEAEFPELSVSLPSDGENVKQTPTGDNPVSTSDEDTGTPRLSSPLKRLVNAEAALMFGGNTVSIKSPLSATSNVLKPFTKLSDNVQLSLQSKIPKLQSFSKSKRKTDDKIASKSSKSIKVAEESDSGVSRRKTFVKKANPSSNYELPIISNEKPVPEDLLNEDPSNHIEPESSKTNKSRKTFVVKTADNLEELEISPCDRRKTFVKKPRRARKKSLMGGNKIDCDDLPSATAVSQLTQYDIPSKKCLIAVVQPENSKVALCDDISARDKKILCATTKVKEISESYSDETVSLYGSKIPSSFENDFFGKEKVKKTDFVTGIKSSGTENVVENDKVEEINCGSRISKNEETTENDTLNIISDKQFFSTLTKSSKTENVGENNEVKSKESDLLNVISDKQDFSTSNETEKVVKNDEIGRKKVNHRTKKAKNEKTTESDTLNIISNKPLFSTSNETENDVRSEVESKEITQKTKISENEGTLESNLLNVISDKKDFSALNETKKVVKNDEIGKKKVNHRTKKTKNEKITESDTLNIISNKSVFSRSNETENDVRNKVENKEIIRGTKDSKSEEIAEAYMLNITGDNLLNVNEIELNESKDSICAVDDDKNLSGVLELSESYIEIPDFDSDIISPKPTFKTTTVRGRISKSKPKKVFRFDGYKKKSTSRKTSIACKPKIMTQGTNISQPDVNHGNKSELENWNSMNSNIAGNDINVAASCESSNDKCQDAAKKYELAKPLDKNTKCKNRIKNKCGDLKDDVDPSSSRNDFTNKIDFSAADVKHPCSHLIVMDEQIQINYQSKKLEIQNDIPYKLPSSSRKVKSTKRTANNDGMKTSVHKKSRASLRKKQIEVIDPEEDAGATLSEDEMDTLKQENCLDAKIKEKLSTKKKGKVRGRKKEENRSPEDNTFSTQAEIHHPPPCFRTLENDSLNKENVATPLKNLQVVLSDVMKFNTNKEINVLDRGKTMMKNPLSSSSCNIHPLDVTNNDATHGENEPEGLKVARRRGTKPVSYKEASLNTKMRRN